MLTAPASAWEFNMTGNFEWTYLYHSQGGHNGFFGPHNSATLAWLPMAAIGLH